MLHDDDSCIHKEFVINHKFELIEIEEIINEFNQGRRGGEQGGAF